jgi:broad specificity phosphatase PhoE
VSGPRDTRLRRLVLLRAGATADPADDRLIGGSDLPLSPSGRAAVSERRRHWEWIDAVFSSPLRRARESAEIVAPTSRVRLVPDLRARGYGDWEGMRCAEIELADPVAFADWRAGRGAAIPRGERLAGFRERIARALERVRESGAISPLVVSHGDSIRELVHLLGCELPEGRPLPAETVVLTLRAEGRFGLGRQSSDPAPLRSPLERDGLSGLDSTPPERHIAPLEIRTEAVG